MKKLILCLFAAAAMLTACHQNISEANYDIIPYPKSVQLEGQGVFVLNPSTTVFYENGNDDLQRNAAFLSDYVKDILGYSLQTASLEDENAEGIVLTVCPDAFQETEAYTITVTPKQVKVFGSDAAGVFYGMQTLRKSLPIGEESDKVALPCGTIQDYPNYHYRGMHLDPARHFFDMDSVKMYIDMLAMHNMNTFHFHITDDQGWRVEIKKYPELTEIGAYRDCTVIGHNSNLYDSIRHGGFYTQDELRDLVQYAADRYINIIPEIDLPGHMQAALATYPDLGCTGGPYKVWSRWGISDDVLCAGNEKAMLFLEDVLNEIMDVFPSEIIHIGGDECPKVRWEQCPKCQAKIKELGIKSDGRFSKEDYLQSYVMDRMEKVIEARGRRVIGWDEILEGQVADNAIIMSWRGTEGGIEAAKKGHDVILVPTSYFYFDYYQSEDMTTEPLGIGGYVPVEKVYSFEPELEELTPEEQKHILGIQANIWTEYIATFDHVMYMALPRAAALSEIQWCNKEQREYQHFVERCRHMADLYDIYHYRYATHIFNPTPIVDTVPVTLATNKPIVLKEQPSKRYSGNGKGAEILNDGVLGKNTYGSGRWLGFSGVPLDATFDLETPVTVSKVKYRANVNKGSWIYNPKDAMVLVSDNGVDFREVASEAYEITTWNDKDGIFSYELSFDSVEARYVEVVINGNDLPKDHEGYGGPAWLFVDEIEIE